MTDPSPRQEATRRWLKLAAIAIAVVVLGFVAIMLAGGGGHEPPVRHGGAATPAPDRGA